jgi:hypothetical protein
MEKKIVGFKEKSKSACSLLLGVLRDLRAFAVKSLLREVENV